MGGQKEEDNFVSSLKHLESFRGKNIIMTGATGGIGSEILTQLEPYCQKIVILVQNPQKFTEVIKDP